MLDIVQHPPIWSNISSCYEISGRPAGFPSVIVKILELDLAKLTKPNIIVFTSWSSVLKYIAS